LQLGVAAVLGLAARPGERELRELGERWRPWRSVAACLFWQSYLHARNRTAPVLPPELYA
jgi:DNA-3-methyladenine glycosylase II